MNSTHMLAVPCLPNKVDILKAGTADLARAALARSLEAPTAGAGRGGEAGEALDGLPDDVRLRGAARQLICGGFDSRFRRGPFWLIWLGKNRGPWWFTWWFNQLPGKPIYVPKKDTYVFFFFLATDGHSTDAMQCLVPFSLGNLS